MQSPDLLERHLEEDELLRRDPRDGALRTTRRFQGAMMRAFARVLSDDAWGEDLRIPLASALLELYPDASDATLVALVAIMLPIESRELALTRPDAAEAARHRVPTTGASMSDPRAKAHGIPFKPG